MFVCYGEADTSDAAGAIAVAVELATDTDQAVYLPTDTLGDTETEK